MFIYYHLWSEWLKCDSSLWWQVNLQHIKKLAHYISKHIQYDIQRAQEVSRILGTKREGNSPAGSNQMWAQHLSLTKNGRTYKKWQFSIEKFAVKNTSSDHQNVINLVKENKFSKGNICYSFDLSQCDEKLFFKCIAQYWLYNWCIANMG